MLYCRVHNLRSLLLLGDFMTDIKLPTHRLHDMIYDKSLQPVCEIRNMSAGDDLVLAINSHKQLLKALNWAEKELTGIYDSLDAGSLRISITTDKLLRLKEMRTALEYGRGIMPCLDS